MKLIEAAAEGMVAATERVSAAIGQMLDVYA